ncbi:MAG TPA: hypothetical protein VMB50_22730 [Myxococcales bacterium]|nr:hypothetical protein [Myxococcales bacterium]
MTCLSLVPLLVALAGPPPPAAAAQRALEQGIRYFDSFEDGRAWAAFRALLQRSPPGQIAAEADLYLGFIALNASQPDTAKLEFRRALDANPVVELPPDTSPKIRLAFEAVRHQVEAELDAAVVRQSAGPVAPGGAALVTSPAPAEALMDAWAEAPPKASRSHALAWTLVGVGAAAAVVAVIGAVEVVQYDQASSSVAAAETGPGPLSPGLSSLASQQSQATAWRAAGFAALGVAAACIPAVILAW